MDVATNRLQDVDELLCLVEDRLARLISSGWRLGSGEAETFVADADSLAAAGLQALACRLRSLATAASPIEALGAATLAASACRLIRAQIAPVEPQVDDWRPLVNPKRQWSREEDAVLPLCRFSLVGTEVWSCLRSRGFSVEWVLLQSPEIVTDDDPHWFRRPLFGHLHWQERHPIGSLYDVQVHRLNGAAWEPSGPLPPDQFAVFRRRFRAENLRESKIPIWGGGSVRMAPFDRDAVDGCQWFDDEVRDRLLRETSEHCWALSWEQAEVQVVIALLDQEDERGRRRRIVHMLPDMPSTELP
jgi:hypothetical protein